MSDTENGKGIIAKDTVFAMQPKNLEEAMSFAKLIADSDLVPKDFQGKPGNVMIAIQMGQELGLKPLQAIQNIAVINGRPCLWGDALLAIVRASGTLEDFREDFDHDQQRATCSAKRRGNPTPIVRTFSKAEAMLAGLWTKQGTWKSYPKRMLQLRARAFTLRDGWADFLKGVSVAEEQRDVIEVEALPEAPTIAPPKRKSETAEDLPGQVLCIVCDDVIPSGTQDAKTEAGQPKHPSCQEPVKF